MPSGAADDRPRDPIAPAASKELASSPSSPVQTFLPFSSFTKCAQVLDRSRLGKQRVEVVQILRALLGETKGWANHPAVLMWAGYEGALVLYGLRICDEWSGRGYRDTQRARLVEIATTHGISREDPPRPPWLGDADIHRGYRSNLLRKDPEHYGPLFEPDLPHDLPYVWPEV